MTFDELRDLNVMIAFTLFNPEPTGSKTIASIPTGVHGTATEYKCVIPVPGQLVSLKPRFWDKKCWCDYGHKLRFDNDWNWFMGAWKAAQDYLQNLERPSQHHCCGGDWLEVDVNCHARDFNLDKAFEALVKLVEWIKQHKDENNSTKSEHSAPECSNEQLHQASEK